MQRGGGLGSARMPDSVAVPGERPLFFRHFLRRPLGIGAIVPSSRGVGEAMARALPPDRTGWLLELGGGTGSVTASLIAAGWPAERLVSVEREADLAAMLARRCPGVLVSTADARAVAGLLDGLAIGALAGVVSSLPIKWFALEDQRAIIDPCLDRLGPGRPLLQLTNAFASPLPMRRLGLAGVEVARLWLPLPPVQIWSYWRARAGAR
jgi:phosphatidylethanolamine/phosphatidyl-N-methylethanolamine N-methyltransferase